MTDTLKNSAEALLDHVAIETPAGGLRGKLALAAKENRPLVVKLGFDPTAPDLHLGHAVVLRKIRQFQDAGHKVVIVIGDFTARIGDPTGRNKTRPPLTEDEVNANAQTYIEQLAKILDMRSDRLTVRRNADWLGTMTFPDVLRLAAKSTVAQMLQREDFSKRYEEGVSIGLHEMFYPLMQGYDSVEIDADIEMGGTDQLFNCMVGRTLQESEDKPGQIVLSMPLLVGLDGKEKMSKSKNNYIGLTDAPNDMYGKTMSIPDAMLPDYLDLATNFSAEERAEMKARLTSGTNPMDIKKAIAHNLISLYHNSVAADEAEAFFYKQFQQRNADEMAYQTVSAEAVFTEGAVLRLVDLCAALQPEESRSQIRRLIQSSAVTVNGAKIIDPMEEIVRPQDSSLRVRVGKRGFYEVVNG